MSTTLPNDEGVFMKCPNCQIDLKRLDLKGIVLDHCEQCDGLWFDKGELERAKNEKDRKLTGFDFPLWTETEKVKAKKGTRACPTCRENLVIINYAGYADVPIDICPRCQGVWLDKGELDKIVSHLEELKKEVTLTSYFKDFEEEAKRLFVSKRGFFAEAKDLLVISKLLLYRIVEAIPPIAG